MELAKKHCEVGLVFAILAGFLVTPSYGQTDSVRTKRVEDRYDDKLIIEITNDTWLDLPEGVEMKTPSLGFKGHFYSDYTFGLESNFSFAWGFGISADNYHSNAEFRQEEFEDGTTGDQVLTPFDEDYEYEKNKHTATYLEVPIELRYIGKGRSAFRLAVGFRIGYLLSDKQKIIDPRGKRKFYDYEHVSTWRYGLNARIGVGKIGITGFYSLVPFIEEGKGTQIIPISVGISFVPFK
jgi:hypothetical protein